MNQQLAVYGPTLRELTFEEIDTVNGGYGPAAYTAAVAVVGAVGAAFAWGYNMGLAAGQALWG